MPGSTDGSDRGHDGMDRSLGGGTMTHNTDATGKDRTMKRWLMRGVATLSGLAALVAISAAFAAAFEVKLEVTGCEEPLTPASECLIRVSWTGDSGGIQDVTFLEYLKSDTGGKKTTPPAQEFRESRSLRPRPGELDTAGPTGLQRARKTSSFGSWLFEGGKPWLYCVKARAKDQAAQVAESRPVCMTGKP